MADRVLGIANFISAVRGAVICDLRRTPTLPERERIGGCVPPASFVDS
jgi:hypothetical protein